MYDVAVVGAGAAGLTAAIFAGRAGASVVALDGAGRIGAKILIAGGGRCNVTHDVVTAGDFNGRRNAIAKVLRTFTVGQTIEWFDRMGVRLVREETGKLFPSTNRARTVLDALLESARNAGVEIRTGQRVTGIDGADWRAGVLARSGRASRPTADGRRAGRPATAAGTAALQRFTLRTNRGAIEAGRVILATGGRSVPKTGSDGSGYELARTCGHTIMPTFPALVPLVIEGDHWARSISGTSAGAELAVTSGSGRVLVRQCGPMLFAHFGISGPAVLDISRHWIAARRDDPAAKLVANFLPGSTFESLERELDDAARVNPRATPASTLRGRIPERLLNALSTNSEPIARLSREARRELIRNITACVLPVSRDRGFDFAEVTAGGVPLEELNLGTMQSRRCDGLYLCGEILDVDGKIGGYNFQWAWASGRLAGVSAAMK